MKQTGFTCDRQACAKFVVGDALPLGWVKLTPNVTEPAVKQDTHTLEFCSNECLAITAVDRAYGLENVDVLPAIRRQRKAEAEAEGGGDVSTDPRAGVDHGLKARHTRWHINEAKPSDECDLCIEEGIAPALQVAS